MNASKSKSTADEPRDEPVPRGEAHEPDVLLDVSELRVDEISLDVEDLRARVSLQADVLQLLKLHVGVEAELGKVQLTIKGVEAKVLLQVRLNNVARIIERVLTTIDNNPDIVEHAVGAVGSLAAPLSQAVPQAVGAVGEVAAGAGEAVSAASAESERQPGRVPLPSRSAPSEEAQARPAKRSAAKRPSKRSRAPRARRSDDR